MEAPAQYGSAVVRPRLTVVKDEGAGYSALPHDIIRDTRLSRDARLLYAVLQMYWWQDGETHASNATLCEDMGCSDSQLRRYLGELLKAGRITARRSGRGQAKAYAPVKATVSNEAQPFISERLNRSSVSGLESNRSPVTPQPFTGDALSDANRSPVTDSIKKTPEKKTKEEDPDISGGAAERELFDYYRQKIQPNARLNAPDKIRTRLNKFTVDELKAGIDHFAADWWWMENNATRGAAWFFDSDRRSEQFLNLKPRPKRDEQRNGHDRMPPGGVAKQRSSWTDSRFRVKTLGGNGDGD